MVTAVVGSKRLVRLREYDDWLARFICASSRRRQPLKNSPLFMRLCQLTPEEAEANESIDGGDGADGRDPMASMLAADSARREEHSRASDGSRKGRPPALAGRRDKAQSQAKSRGKPMQLKVPVAYGSQAVKTITLMKWGRAEKTIWLDQADVPWFLSYMAEEHHNRTLAQDLVIRDLPEGVPVYVHGESAWKVHWTDTAGLKHDVGVSVPSAKVKQPGTIVPLQAEEFSAAKQRARSQVISKANALGAAIVSAASDRRSESDTEDCQDSEGSSDAEESSSSSLPMTPSRASA